MLLQLDFSVAVNGKQIVEMREVKNAEDQHLLRLLAQRGDERMRIKGAVLFEMRGDSSEQLRQDDMLFGDVCQTIHLEIRIGGVSAPYPGLRCPCLRRSLREQLADIIKHAVIEGRIGETAGQ